MATEKLLPPSIESKLPAQIGDTIRIPFLPNRSVGENQYEGMVLKIKSVATNLDIATLYGTKNGIFTLTNTSLLIGQHYKAQLAYYTYQTDETDQTKKTKQIGYYSSAGVFKYTATPILKVSSNGQFLEVGARNSIGNILYGHYSNPGDKTEKVYSYCFNVYEDGKLYATSGEQLHNSSNDSAEEAKDSYVFNLALNPLSIYQIEYKVITMNGLQAISPIYCIGESVAVPNPFDFTLDAEVNNEIGGVKITMNYNGDVQGRFRLLRFTDGHQETIKEFILNNMIDGKQVLHIDYTVSHNVNYQYGLQQYNDSFATEVIKSNKIQVNFEDMFLFDGERQLKIKFNPKVSSFKNTILESKLDTIGGQFPFVFRNGRVKYKEFPISGLISYWMDNEQVFLQNKDLYLNSNACERNLTASQDSIFPATRSTNLTASNIAAERIFKLEVLEWLNNGKPKLFRSPTEGNYIVRLLNVSLSPEDQLGRMLHTFNCTAYEVADYTYVNLKEYGFVRENIDAESLQRFYSVDVVDTNAAIAITPALWARIYGDVNSTYELTFKSGVVIEIMIRYSGMYEISCPNDLLVSVKLTAKTDKIGFPYKVEYATTQNDVDIITYKNQPIKAVSLYEFNNSFEGSGENGTEIISKIAREEQNQLLENILVLKLEYTGETGSSEVSYKYSDDTIGSLTMGANSSIIETDGPWKRIVAGRLELTANDFDGRFILKELTIGQNIRADIYYQVKKIEVSE